MRKDEIWSLCIISMEEICIFYKNFEILAGKQDKTPQTIAPEIPVSSGTVTNLKQGKKKPHKTTLKLIADFFGVSVDYMFQDHSIENTNLADDEKELLRYYREMNDAGKFSALMSVKGMSEQDIFKKKRTIDSEN